MKLALCATVLSGAAANQCCYPSCGSSGCNAASAWCSQSQSNCEGACKGHFCPSGPSPSPGPGPSPSPAPEGAYCPEQESFGHDGNVQFHGNGWTLTGGGGVHSIVSWNLNGGFVEFDMDTSRAQGGVNTNLYTTSPDKVEGKNDCDIQGVGKPSCMEMDIIEMNGNCYGQSTVHTWPNHNGGCDRGGCWSAQRIGGKFHVKASFGSDGWMRTDFNGQRNDHYNPTPSAACKKNVVDNMNSKGAQIQSSQWVGWVPGANQCPGGGNLGGSSFTISNLIVKGTVVQGPEPKKCSAEQLSRAANSTASVLV